MIHNKLLSLLVLLMTAATGAWAEDATTVFELNGSTASVGTLTLGSTGVTSYTVKIHSNTEEIAGIRMGNNYNFAEGKYFTIAPATGSFKKGDKVSIAVCFNINDDTKEAKAVIYAADHETLLYTTANGVNGRTSTADPVVEEYVLTQDASVLYIGRKGNTATYVTTLKVVRTASASSIDVTTNAAEGETTFTEASFAMPASDATVDYELVRDMSVSMPVTVGDGSDGYRIRVKKNGQGMYEPAEITLQQLMAMVKVHDDIENKDLNYLPTGTPDCSVSIYAVDEEGLPTGQPVNFQELVPGRYAAKATAAAGSVYDGETAISNIFVLYQGYEIKVAGGEYATYYKDENICVEDPDAQLYTISTVSETEATAKQVDIVPANYPMLVYNSSSVTKTILLIPTEDEPLSFMCYEGFKGTLEPKELPASSETTNYYVLDGHQFVWVRDAGTIAANRCWLEVEATTSNARRLTIVFDEATAIQNAQLTIDNYNWYDLSGRKFNAAPTKPGIYVKGGKKVVIK